MKQHFYYILFSFLILNFADATPSEQKLRMLYSSLSPKSVSQHIAFYELYPNHPLGQQALKDAWLLISPRSNSSMESIDSRSVSSAVISSLVALINRSQEESIPPLSESTLTSLEKFSKQLSHHKLQGHQLWNEEAMSRLPLDKIDIARGVLLTLYGDDKPKIKTYEALLDLMALQIAARLPSGATPALKIRVINNFVFDEMGFRFPPHSVYPENIDIYTFLPSVIDSHRGVCLGVSILYLCLAQRLDLPLEIVTPPGHIYVRYNDGNQHINIETTARGVHIDSEEYLNINLIALQQRTTKEVLGLSHCNYAALLLQKGEYQKALDAYIKASLYLPNDPLVKELMGYSYLFLGDKEKAVKLLNEIKGIESPYTIKHETMAEEYLNGNVDVEGLKAMFSFVDEDRESRLKEKKGLEAVVKRCPQFRAGILHLASLWMQLYRFGEAFDSLECYHALDANDPSVEYYMAALSAERMDYNKAWEHYRIADALVKAKGHNPKDLQELRKSLIRSCPE